MFQAEVAASVERLFLGTIIWVGVVYLLVTATPDHFTAILGFSGPLIGAVTSFFFRLNGQAADSQQTTVRTAPGTHVAVEPKPDGSMQGGGS